MESAADLELLLACAAWAADESQTGTVAEKAAKVSDWVCFVETAQRHGLAALAFTALEACGKVPADGLAAEFATSAKRGLVLSAEAGRVARLMGEAGVCALVFKGPVLAQMAYRDPAQRTFQDVDLLVAPQQLEAAIALLTRDGYAETGDERVRAARRTMRPWCNELAFHHAGRRTWLDLHWFLLPPFFPARIPTSDVFERAIPVELGGGTICTLAPDDHLVYLCAHACKHAWESLGAVADIACLLRHPGVDQSRARHRARQWGAAKMFDFSIGRTAALPVEARLGDLRLLKTLSPSLTRWGSHAATRAIIPTETDWETMPKAWTLTPARQCIWRLLRIAGMT